MGDEFSYFSLESKSAALRLLADFLKRRDADARFLGLIHVLDKSEDDGIIFYLPKMLERKGSFIRWPLSQGDRATDNKLDFDHNLKLFKQAYTDLTHSVALDGAIDHEVTRLVPLSGDRIATLFLAEPDQLEAPPPISDESIREWLMIATDISIDRARVIFEDLQRSSTQVRWTVADDKGTATYFFHVLDDEERRSNFISWHQGEYFDDCQTLIAQSYGQFRLFVHQTDPIPADRIYPCSQLLYYAPSLFTDRPVAVVEPNQDAPSLPLAAFFRNPDDPNDQTLQYLVGLTFRIEVPAVINWPDVTVFDLQESAGRVDSLKESLNNQERTGYRLALRKGQYKSYDETLELEYDKINRAIYQLGYRKTYIANLRPKRWRLLRYAADRLDLFAARLRMISREALNNKEIQYGFQATEREPDGMHFLLIPPDVTLDEQDKPYFRTRLSDPHTEFWIDPLWSSHYSPNVNDCPLFVPKHHVLHPSIHSWKISNMEQYLHDMVTTWYQDSHGFSPEIPQKPIYVVDFNQEDADRDLSFFILDRSKFQPLAGAFKSINDNLILFDWRGDNISTELGIDEIPALIQTASGARQKEAIATWLQQRADDQLAAYMTARDAAVAQIATYTHDLEAGLTEEINKVITDATELTQQAHDLNQQLSSLRGLYRSMIKETDRAIDLTHQLHEEAEERLDSKIVNLKERVENAIKQAKQKRQGSEDDIRRDVDQFHETRARLEAQLKRLRRENWR